MGNPKNAIITNEVKEGWSTVAATNAVVKHGTKVYYELAFNGKVEGNSLIGWVTNNFNDLMKIGTQ